MYIIHYCYSAKPKLQLEKLIAVIILPSFYEGIFAFFNNADVKKILVFTEVNMADKKNSAREQAFIITFEKSFNSDVSVDELIEFANESENLTVSQKAQAIAKGIEENIESIDITIEKHLRSWKKARLSKVALAVLRLGVYELEISKPAPVGVIISEEVNICKLYGSDEDKSFVNGVLGSVARAMSEEKSAE